MSMLFNAAALLRSETNVEGTRKHPRIQNGCRFRLGKSFNRLQHAGVGRGNTDNRLHDSNGLQVCRKRVMSVMAKSV
jgi:hypothetical protein